jgi:hypothetical protein
LRNLSSAMKAMRGNANAPVIALPQQRLARKRRPWTSAAGRRHGARSARCDGRRPSTVADIPKDAIGAADPPADRAQHDQDSRRVFSVACRAEPARRPVPIFRRVGRYYIPVRKTCSGEPSADITPSVTATKRSIAPNQFQARNDGIAPVRPRGRRHSVRQREPPARNRASAPRLTIMRTNFLLTQVIVLSRNSPARVRAQVLLLPGKQLTPINLVALQIAAGQSDPPAFPGGVPFCEQKTRFADCVRVRAVSERQRGSQPELCSVAGIPSGVCAAPCCRKTADSHG